MAPSPNILCPNCKSSYPLTAPKCPQCGAANLSGYARPPGAVWERFWTEYNRLPTVIKFAIWLPGWLLAANFMYRLIVPPQTTSSLPVTGQNAIPSDILARKNFLEKWLPVQVTEDLQSRPDASGVKSTLACKKISLTYDTPNHYVGIAYYSNGGQAKITVVEDGQNINWQTSPL